MYRTINSVIAAGLTDSDLTYVPGKLIGFAFNLTTLADVGLAMDSGVPGVGLADVFVNGAAFRLTALNTPFYCALSFDMPASGGTYRIFTAAQPSAREVVWYYEDSPLLYR